MNHLKLIITREYLNKIRNKSFIIMTFLSPLIFIGLFSLVAFLSRLNNEEKQTITIFDASGVHGESFKDHDSFHFKYAETILGLDVVKDEVVSKEEYGVFYIPESETESPTFFAESSPGPDILNYLTGVLENEVFEQNLKISGVDIAKINEANARVDIKVENFSGEESSKISGYLKLIFGGIAGYFLMMFIIVYGNMIMRSVIEEKTNRIIEIIISSVKPIQLMMGKIIGTSLAGITQFLVWVILGGILTMVVSAVFHVDLGAVETPQKAMLENSGAMDALVQNGVIEFLKLPLLSLIVSFFLYFIGGYLLYSSLYVSIGAAVDSETDTQQFMMPVIMVLMLAVYVGFFTVINNPHGTVATVFSFIPFTSPIVMLMRIPFGVDWWQVLLSLVILYATFGGVVWFAAKVYRVGILMYGKKASYKEIYKWMKYKS